MCQEPGERLQGGHVSVVCLKLNIIWCILYDMSLHLFKELSLPDTCETAHLHMFLHGVLLFLHFLKRISSSDEAKHEEMKSEDCLERGCPCYLVGLPQRLIIPDMLMQGLMGCSCSFVKIASLTKNMQNKLWMFENTPGFRLANKKQGALEICLEDPCEGSRIIASNRPKLMSTLYW